MKQFDPVSLLSLSDHHLVSMGRILGDVDAFPVLCVMNEKTVPVSAAQLAHELGASVEQLLPILSQLVSDGLAAQRGRAYRASGTAALVIGFVKEIVKDVSLDGTETSCNSSVTLTAGPGGRDDVAIGPSIALTNNHTLVDFTASALVLSRRISVERPGASVTSTGGGLTINSDDERTANEAPVYVDL
jgi:hypothetical protein